MLDPEYRTSGFTQRTFNVVVHLNSDEVGGPRLLQHVAAASVQELMEKVGMRLDAGLTILSVSVYDELADTYQPLRPAMFPHLPSHLELDVKATRALARATDDWTAGDGGTSFDDRRRRRETSGGGSSGGLGDEWPDLRRQVVERIRALFLPYFNRQQITRTELSAACADLLDRFSTERGLTADDLRTERREITLQESDLLRRLGFEYTIQRGYDKRGVAHREGAMAHSSRTAGGAQSGYGYDDMSAGVGHRVIPPSSGRGAMARGDYHDQSGAKPAPKPAFGSTAGRFGGSVGGTTPASARRTASSRRHHRLPTGALFDGADTRSSTFREPETSFYNPTAATLHRRQATLGSGGQQPQLGPFAAGGTSPSSARHRVGHFSPEDEFYAQPGGSAASAGSVSRAGTGSIGGIESVSYTVAGTFPNAPSDGGAAQSAGPAELRAVLSPPAIASAEDDVVVSAAIHHQGVTSVTLCWWLAYGPQRIVLNLDKLYSNGMVTTLQISENSVALTIRGGVLVPGWDYAVHLDVGELQTGRVSTAQTQFLVPGQAPGRIGSQASMGSSSSTGNPALAPPGIGSATDLEARRQEYLMAKRSAGKWVGMGYAADAEPGALTRTEGGHGQVQDGPAARVAGRSASPPKRGQVTGVAKGQSAAAAAAAAMAAQQQSSNATPTRQMLSKPHTPTPAGELGSPSSLTPPHGLPAASGSPPSHQQQSSTAAPSGTYQEQLRDFFVQQIEPLYHLSANPSLSEQAFKTAVRAVSKQYWFANHAKATLTDDMKRDIVRDVKAAVARARETSTTKPATQFAH